MRVYEVGHAADSLDLKPKTAGLALKRFLLSSSEIVRKFSDGIAPLDFQLLTAESPTPASPATAAVPPRASTMSSTELSMRKDSSPIVKLSRLHAGGMDHLEKLHLNNGMDSKKIVGDRLRVWLLSEGISAADLCKRIDCKENQWSQYSSGKRMVSHKVADQLCRTFALTLDWIYRGDPRAEISEQTQIKMKKIRDNEKAGAVVGPGRRAKAHKGAPQGQEGAGRATSAREG